MSKYNHLFHDVYFIITYVTILVMKNEMIYKTIIVDDHPLVCQALKDEFAKEAQFVIVAEANDGLEGVKLVTELKPDVVIMDIGLPKLNGIEATRQIKTAFPDIFVMILTVHDDIEHILGILESGADGYLTKNILVEDIVQSVRLMVAGEKVLSPQIFRQVLKYALRYNTKPKSKNTTVNLTSREITILGLLAKGLSNKEIADQMGMGSRTVKSYLVDVFSKLNVRSRTAAVITGLQAGLFKLDDLV
jgi:DNA-binding NarL/FixJ family response regulator